MRPCVNYGYVAVDIDQPSQLVTRCDATAIKPFSAYLESSGQVIEFKVHCILWTHWLVASSAIAQEMMFRLIFATPASTTP